MRKINPHPKSSPKRFDMKSKGGRKAWIRLKDEVWARDRGVCQLCYRDTVVPEFHHVIYKSQGGSDTIDNILLLCFDCHHTIHHGNHDSDKMRRLAEKRMGATNGKEL